MTRLLAVGLLLWAISPVPPVAAQSDVVRLLDEPLVDGLSVRVTQGRSGIGVDIYRGPVSRGETTPPFAEMAVQAWVLKSDGTAIAMPKHLSGQAIPVSQVLRDGRPLLSRRIFLFEPADPRDLAAVVVSLDGKMFVRPIPQKPAN